MVNSKIWNNPFKLVTPDFRIRLPFIKILGIKTSIYACDTPRRNRLSVNFFRLSTVGSALFFQKNVLWRLSIPGRMSSKITYFLLPDYIFLCQMYQITMTQNQRLSYLSAFQAEHLAAPMLRTKEFSFGSKRMFSRKLAKPGTCQDYTFPSNNVACPYFYSRENADMPQNTDYIFSAVQDSEY